MIGASYVAIGRASTRACKFGFVVKRCNATTDELTPCPTAPVWQSSPSSQHSTRTRAGDRGIVRSLPRDFAYSGAEIPRPAAECRSRRLPADRAEPVRDQL